MIKNMFTMTTMKGIVLVPIVAVVTVAITYHTVGWLISTVGI